LGTGESSRAAFVDNAGRLPARNVLGCAAQDELFGSGLDARGDLLRRVCGAFLSARARVHALPFAQEW